MLPTNVHHYKSSKPGPVAIVMGGMHGDEFCGVDAVNYFLEFFTEHDIQSGELYLIIANPKAVELGQRAVDFDINRLFLDELNPDFQGTYEEQRVEELKPILEKADYLLDLHSTGNPSISFSVALNKTPKHSEILNCLPVTFPSYGWGSKIPGTDMAWVDSYGGVGLTVEAGWQDDPATSQIAIDSAKAFLTKLGIYKFDNFEKPSFTQYLNVLENFLVEDIHTFDYSKDYENFEPVQAGELIAKDSLREYRAPDKENLLIVFPTKVESIRKGFIREAFLVGEFKELEVDTNNCG